MSERGHDAADESARRRALAAWCEVSGGVAAVDAESLSGGRHSAAVRLRDAGGASVVAKLRPRGGLDLERAIHEQVLPALGVDTPRCLGFVPGRGDECDVLLLEDLGDRPFDPGDPAHQRAAGRWLGRCHAASVGGSIPDCVPRRGPGEEREGVAATRRALAGVRVEAPGEPVADGVARALDLLGAAEERHGEWARVAASVPVVLTHGAFVTRNVRMRGDGDSLATLPFDWDHVAVRSPAIDLASLPGASRGFAANASLGEYRRLASEAGIALTWDELGALSRLGTLLRAAACIGWLVPALAGRHAAHAARELDLYCRALACALQH